MNNKSLQFESNVEKIKQIEKESMQKYGWYFHYVFDDENDIGSINAHTHGFEKSINHLNFQIVLNLDTGLCHSIFSEFYLMIKNGDRFEDKVNINIYEIIDNYPIRLIKVNDEQDGKILRIIFPDENGLFPEDEGCDPEYIEQIHKVVN